MAVDPTTCPDHRRPFRAHIDDVIVDAGARGHGAGMALVDHALEVARAAGARTVDLTSRPAREAATRLSERAGFQRRESNVYRLAFARPSRDD